MLVEGHKIELFFKIVPIGLFAHATKTSKLKKVNLTFDAQNMPKNANYKIFSGLA
jgi:hypothetical protein